MERCIELYDELLGYITADLNHNMKMLSTLDVSSKETNIRNFHHSLQDDLVFTLFSKMKIKVFSAKTEETHLVSCSLLSSNFTLKYLFNNMTDLVKTKLWGKVFKIYITYDSTLPTPNNERTTELRANYKLHLETNKMEDNLASKVKNDILKVNVNAKTNNMIDDIVNSFQDIMKKGNTNGNPFDNIMNITNMITDKYKSNIDNGDIELDKILGGINNVIPGLMPTKKTPEEEKAAEPVIINEEFSTANVNVGKEEEEESGGMGGIMKMVPGMSGLMNMMTRLNTANSDADLATIKNDMDNILEKDLKIDMSQFKETMTNMGKNVQSTNTIVNTLELD